MYFKIFPPIVLQIYKNSMLCLLDEDWLFSYLPKTTINQISLGKLPENLFVRPIQNGYLYYLGTLFFDQLFNIILEMFSCNVKEAYAKSDMLFLLLSLSGVEDSKILFNLLMALDEVDTIFCEVSEKKQNFVFHKQDIDVMLQNALVEAKQYYKDDISNIKDIYAKNFAERAFHDRQMCEYITYSLHTSYEEGYPVLNEKEQLSYVKVERVKWPAWVKPTLMSRDRGKCANCGADFIELNEQPHIDHIVPLNKGGCNDIVNLQLLCSSCNGKKHDNFQLVNSSIPEYLNWHQSRKTKKLDLNNYPNTPLKP